MQDIYNTKYEEDTVIASINIYMDDLFTAFIREGIEINDTNIEMFFKHNPELKKTMQYSAGDMVLDMLDTLVSDSKSDVDYKYCV